MEVGGRFTLRSRDSSGSVNIAHGLIFFMSTQIIFDFLIFVACSALLWKAALYSVTSIFTSWPIWPLLRGQEWIQAKWSTSHPISLIALRHSLEPRRPSPLFGEERRRALSCLLYT